MKIELQKRLLTSIFLLLLLYLMFSYTFVLIISLIIISIISWIEFYGLITKILNKKNKILKFFYKAVALAYLSILTFFILITNSNNSESEIFIIYSILISVMSDVGGIVIGRIFKGKLLTKISPKKTISGSIGAFIFSIALIPFFYSELSNINLVLLFIFTMIISLTSQLGDLFISYLKRKAKVKNTSDLLPGHGGFLDRIDGIIFSIPVGFLLLNYS